MSLQKTPSCRFVTEFGTLPCSPVGEEGEENKKTRTEKRRKLDEKKKE